MTTSAFPIDISALRRIGRGHLKADRIDAALPAFAEIVRRDPSDVEACLVVGDAYLAAGDAASAYGLYVQAAAYQPDHPDLGSRLSLAQAELGQGGAGPVSAPLEPDAITTLVRRLTGRRTVISDQDMDQAAVVLREILASPRPAEAVAQRMQEIERLIPALIATNARQARQAGRLDLAAALQQLGEGLTPEVRPAPAARRCDPARPRLLVVGAGDGATAHQAFIALHTAGYQVDELPTPLSPAAGRYDVIIAHLPYREPKLVERLGAWTADGARLIVSLDDEALASTAAGVGRPPSQAAYAACLKMAQAVCVPSPAQAEHFSWLGLPAHIIPAAWDRVEAPEPAARSKPAGLTLGWLNAWGSAADLAEIRRPVTSLLREFPDLRLLIAGDLPAFQPFVGLPEARRQFVPLLAAEDQPAILSQIDILLLPWQDTALNRARSDQPVLAAGLHRLPWVASPMPAAADWKAGGLVADRRDDWYLALRRLIVEASVRAQLGQAGAAKAETRELSRIGRLWPRLIETVLAEAAAPTAPSPLPVPPPASVRSWGGLAPSGLRP